MRTFGPALILAGVVLAVGARPADSSNESEGAEEETETPAVDPSEPQVVGGSPAAAGRWNDAAAVYFDEMPGCTGTLIAPNLVVTAGHCIAGVTHVKLGVTDLAGDGGEAIAVIDEFEYPDSWTNFDVGLLILEQDSAFTPRVLATGCVLERYLENGAPVSIVGWGAIDQAGEQLTSRLMEGSSMVTDFDCSGGRGCNASVSPNGELAAGGNDVDSCFGDSGGPLYLMTDIGEYLVGVTSRGFEDAQTPCGEGGIYVRADAVLAWIEEVSGQTIPLATCNSRPAPTADVTELEVKAGDSVSAQLTANDPDTGDTHSFAVAAPPAHGEVTIEADGTMVYTASEDYDGGDQFTVQVADSGIPSLSAEVAFQVTVLPGDGCGCRASGRDRAAPLVLALAALIPLARRRRRPRG